VDQLEKIIEIAESVAAIRSKVDDLPTTKEVEEIVVRHVSAHSATCDAKRLALSAKKILWLVIGGLITAVIALVANCG
jgi:hypothetical protein